MAMAVAQPMTCEALDQSVAEDHVSFEALEEGLAHRLAMACPWERVAANSLEHHGEVLAVSPVEAEQCHCHCSCPQLDFMAGVSSEQHFRLGNVESQK